MSKKNLDFSERFTFSRSESSLQLLTIKFLELLRQSKNNTIDLKYAVDKLNVVKRRIYDITNILEGLGMLHKISVNVSKWVGDDLKSILDDCLFEKQNEKNSSEELEMKELMRKEAEIDEKLKHINNEITVLTMEPENSKFLYVTYDDLSKLESLKCKTAFAVKAPQDSYFEGNEDKGNHVMQITAIDDKIDVYYIEEK
ncbi:hypothetical protein GVAV_000618 [Gurleya vavrai]